MAIKIKLFIWLIFVLSSAVPASGQYNSILDVFKSDLKKADELFDKRKYASAKDLYVKHLEKNTEDDNTKLKLARTYRKLKDPINTGLWYTKIKDNTLIQSKDMLYYAESLLFHKKYNEAKRWYSNYLLATESNANIEGKIKGLDDLFLLFEDSLYYTIKELTINSPNNDYSSSYYKKGILFLSSREDNSVVKRINSLDNQPLPEIYFSSLLNKEKFEFSEPEKISIKSGFNNGQIDVAGDSLLFLTLYKSDKDNKNNLKIFYSESKNDHNIGEGLKPLPFLNPKFSYSYPHYFPERKTLYFASDMEGGYGGSDIYKSYFENGTWSVPINLGASINTEGDEVSPFVSGSHFYFASDGHTGLGGLDVFFTDIEHEGSLVLNMGYPINSSFDDFSLIINDKSGLVSSNRKDGRTDDIYGFNVNKIQLKGKLTYLLNRKEIKDADLILTENGAVVKDQKLHSPNGEFVFWLKPGKIYKLNISKDEVILFDTIFKVSSNIKELHDLQIELSLDKKRKVFLKGILNDSLGNPISNVSITIKDKTLNSFQTIVTNIKGEFLQEMDPEDEYLIICQKDSIFAIANVSLDVPQRGSYVQIQEFELIKLPPSTIKGIVYLNANIPAENAGVKIFELITNKEISKQTDKDGNFSFQGFSFLEYTLQVSFKGKYKEIHSLGNNEINVVLE
jgi:hypothetical protein